MNTILIIESIILSSDLDIKFLKAFQLDPFKMEILHPINYLDMSGIQVTTKIHFIAALLVHAIADVDFYSYEVFGYKGHAGICIKYALLYCMQGQNPEFVKCFKVYVDMHEFILHKIFNLNLLVIKISS